MGEFEGMSKELICLWVYAVDSCIPLTEKNIVHYMTRCVAFEAF